MTPDEEYDLACWVAQSLLELQKDMHRSLITSRKIDAWFDWDRNWVVDDADLIGYVYSWTIFGRVLEVMESKGWAHHHITGLEKETWFEFMKQNEEGMVHVATFGDHTQRINDLITSCYLAAREALKSERL